MKQYISKISFLFFFLSFSAATISLFYPGINFLLSAVLSIVFGLNALGALLPMYLLPQKNPLTVYIISMIARMAIVTSAIVTFYYIFPQNSYVFFLQCMVLFITFQVVEIQHLNRDKAFFSSLK